MNLPQIEGGSGLDRLLPDDAFSFALADLVEGDGPVGNTDFVDGLVTEEDSGNSLPVGTVPDASPGNLLPDSNLVGSEGLLPDVTLTNQEADLRAQSLGDWLDTPDMLTIVLVENIDTAKRSAAQTRRDGSGSITPPTAGLLSFLNPNT